MADTKITALTALTAADPANDVIPIVDVSDTSMAASGTTKKISVNNILSSSPTASGALTVTGLVTAGSATITGDLTVDTSTLKVDSTNNRVGIGTASPAVQLHVNAGNGNQLVLSNAGEQFTLIEYRNSTTGKAQQYWDNTNSIFESYLNSTGAFTWKQTATEMMRLNTTGNLVLKGGTVAANGVGVTFPATQVASSDANCLDDYEEGTWTGTLKGSTTDPTVALTATGVYTKIGRVVTVTIRFSGSTVGASGAVSITGLPFTSSQETPGSVISSNALTFTGIPAADINASSSTIEFFQTTSSGALSTVTHSAGLSRSILVSLTYIV